MMRADEVAAVDPLPDIHSSPVATDPTPIECELPPPSDMHPAGAVAPQRPPELPEEPAVEGRSAAPKPQVKGDVVAPGPSAKPLITDREPFISLMKEDSASIRGRVRLPE